MQFGMMDTCVIVCLIARWRDLDELGVHFGGLGSLLVRAASLWCHLGSPRVASMCKSAIWQSRRSRGTDFISGPRGMGGDRGPAPCGSLWRESHGPLRWLQQGIHAVIDAWLLGGLDAWQDWKVLGDCSCKLARTSSGRGRGRIHTLLGQSFVCIEQLSGALSSECGEAFGCLLQAQQAGACFRVLGEWLEKVTCCCNTTTTNSCFISPK